MLVIIYGASQKQVCIFEMGKHRTGSKASEACLMGIGLLFYSATMKKVSIS